MGKTRISSQESLVPHSNVIIQNPGDDGLIRRAQRMSNTIPGISRFPYGVLLAQHRIEGIILHSLAGYSNIEVQRSVEPTSITYNDCKAENQSLYPIKIEIAQVKAERAWYQDAASNGNKAVDTHGKVAKGGLNGLSDEPATQEVIRAKYVIGCDGAHSWTRRQLGFQMEGEQSEYVWGVLGKSA